MKSPSRIEQRRKLAMLIAESLSLADELGLRLVGISLDTALMQLNAGGLATGDDSVAH